MPKNDRIEEFLSKLQLENPSIFEIKFDSVPVWCIIKRPLFFALRKHDSSGGIKKKIRINHIFFIFKFFIASIQFVWYLIHSRLFRVPNSLFFMQASRRFKHNNRYYEPYIDGIYIDKGSSLNAIAVENMKSLRSFKPRSKSIHIIENIIKFPDFFLKFRKTKIKEIAKSLEYLYKELPLDDSNSLMLKLKKILLSNMLYRKIYDFYIQKHRSKLILGIMKPRFIILVSSEGHLGMISAAKELNIPVIEQQHGLITQSHPIYDWPAYLKSNRSKLLTPDFIFLYGNYWKEILLQSGYWGSDQLLSVGSFKFSLKTKNIIYPEKHNYITILYSANPRLEVFEINFFNDLLRLLTKEVDVKVIIKLHPKTNTKSKWNELMNKYNDIFEVFLGSEIDIFDLFKFCDIHLSAYSFAVFESLAMNIPTFIFQDFDFANAQQLFDNNLLTPIKSASELVSLIKDKQKLNSITNALSKKSIDFFSNYDTEMQYKFIVDNILKNEF